MQPRNQQSGMEFLFLVPIFVLGFTAQTRHYGGGHTTKAGAIFDASVTLICLVCYIIALIRKQMRQNQAPGQMPPGANTQYTPAPQNLLMAIPYSSRQSDQWRCLMYSSLRSPGSQFLMFGFPALVGIVIAALTKGFSSIPAFATSALEITGGVYAFLVLLIVAAVTQMYPAGTTVRSCTVGLSPEGLYDIMPSKTALIPWTKVRSIVVAGQGDIYFFTKSGCNYCPSVMKDMPDEGQLLIQTATELWKGRPVTGTNLPIILPPPPPMYNPMPPPGWQPQQNPGATWPPPPAPDWQQWPQQQQPWPQQQQPWPQQPPQGAPWPPPQNGAPWPPPAGPQQPQWPPQGQPPSQPGQWPPPPPS